MTVGNFLVSLVLLSAACSLASSAPTNSESQGQQVPSTINFRPVNGFKPFNYNAQPQITFPSQQLQKPQYTGQPPNGNNLALQQQQAAQGNQQQFVNQDLRPINEGRPTGNLMLKQPQVPVQQQYVPGLQQQQQQVQQVAQVHQPIQQPQEQFQQLQPQHQVIGLPAKKNEKTPKISVTSNVSNVNIGNKSSQNYNFINNQQKPAKGSSSRNIIDSNGNPAMNQFAHGESMSNLIQQHGQNLMPSGGNLMEKLGKDGRPKKMATPEQEKMKEKLLEVASKALAGPESDNGEPLLKFNKETNTLEQVPSDPNARQYKEQLWEALGMLKPKNLSVKKLRSVLGDVEEDELRLRDGYQNELRYGHLVGPNGNLQRVDQPAANVQRLREEPFTYAGERPGSPLEVIIDGKRVPKRMGFIEQGGRLQPGMLQQEMMSNNLWVTPEDYNLLDRDNLIAQVRGNLDDRLNRISDLLYFRPEFMNQLINIDDARELTPMESEFKRLILCYSNEQFCLPPEELSLVLNQQVQRGPVEDEQQVQPANSEDFYGNQNEPEYLHRHSASESYSEAHSSTGGVAVDNSLLVESPRQQQHQQQLYSTYDTQELEPPMSTQNFLDGQPLVGSSRNALAEGKLLVRSPMARVNQPQQQLLLQPQVGRVDVQPQPLVQMITQQEQPMQVQRVPYQGLPAAQQTMPVSSLTNNNNNNVQLTNFVNNNEQLRYPVTLDANQQQQQAAGRNPRVFNQQTQQQRAYKNL